MQKNLVFEKLTQFIDKEKNDLIDLCLRLGNISSPHSKERALGETVLRWLKEAGIRGELQLITDESANAIATIPGVAAGESLILNAHMDTGPELGPNATENERKLETAWIDGDTLYGKGMINDKAQLCAFMIAMRAIKRCGIDLKGDLTLTAVAFETGNPSVDGWQGFKYPGEGFGTKWAVDRGVVADYALVGETSGFGIVQAECGAAWFKIRVKGREVYTPRLERGSSIQENPNAFAKAARVILALEEWAVEYQNRETMTCGAGTIVPKAQVVAVRGSSEGIGRPSPICDIFFDVRIVPEKKPGEVRKDLERLVRKLNLDCDVVLFQYSRGHVAKNAEPLVAAVTRAHEYVFGTPPRTPPSAETSMWRDLNVFNEVGIPSICFGPPRQREPLSGAQNRAMRVDDLVQATKIYALTALTICGIERVKSDTE